MTRTPSAGAARLCVVGSINMDLVVQAPALPRPGETLLGGPFANFPGGKGANQAVAAARFGAAVALIGRLGDDDFGHALRQGLLDEGVDCDGVTLDPHPRTGIAMITVDAAGENTIVVAPGANDGLHPHRVIARRAQWEDADALLLQLEVPLDTVAHAAHRAHTAGRRVILNAAPAQPLRDELLAVVDVLIVNRGEAVTLLGADADDHTLLSRLRDRGVRTVVMTRGAAGAIAADTNHDGFIEQPSFPVRAIDAVGAGDAFAGVLATALSEGRALPAALRLACAAGALATTRAGAQTSLPERTAIESLLRGS